MRHPKYPAYKNRVGLLPLVAPVLMAVLGQADPSFGQGKIPVDFTAGAYLRPLPNITVFSTAVPLVFKWPFVPAHQLQRLRDMISSTCKSTDRRPVCELPRNLVDNSLKDWDRKSWLEAISEAPLATDGDTITDAFVLPTRRHAKRMIISPIEAEDLEKRLAEVGGVKNLSAPCFPVYSPAVNSQPDWGLLTLALSIISTQADVLRMCQTRRLSPSVVHVEKLREELRALQRSVESRGWELAIQHFSRYYILSLVDCLLSPTSLYLFLVIPLTKANTTSVSLHSFVPIPFAYRKFTCTITAPATELALIRTKDGVQLGKLQCNPYRDELCSLEAAHDMDTLPMRCAKRVAVGGAAAEVASDCPLICVRSTETRVITLNPFTYLVTHPPPGAEIRCPGGRWGGWSEEMRGSFQISLPCDCHLTLNGSDVTPSFPCIPSIAPSLSIRRLIPAAWSTLLSLNLPPFSFAHSSSCDDVHECLTSTWKPEEDAPLVLAPWLLIVNIAVIILLCVPSLLLSLRLYIDCSKTPEPFYLRDVVPGSATGPPSPPPPTSPRRIPPSFPPPAVPGTVTSFRRPPQSLAADTPVYEVIQETTYLPMSQSSLIRH